jgi:hypothetical protein
MDPCYANGWNRVQARAAMMVPPLKMHDSVMYTASKYALR